VDVGAAEAPIMEELPANTNVPVDDQTDTFERLAAPRGAPDDRTKLNGVGPQLEKKLNDAGVYHFWQIAAMQPDDVTKLDADLKLNGRASRDGWVEQARTMLDAVAA
jgi:small subunit ribosomal protein S2